MQSSFQIIRRLVRENHDLIVRSYPKTVLLLILLTGVTPVIAWLGGQLASGAITGISQWDFVALGSGIGCLFAVRGGLSYMQATIISGTGNLIIARLQRRIFDALTDGHDPQSPDQDSARAAARIVHGARAARTVLEQLFNGFLKDVLMLAALVGVMLYNMPVPALTLGAALPVIIYVGHKLQSRQRAATRTEFAAISEIVATAQDVAAGGRIIRAFDARDYFLKRAQVAIDTVQQQASRIAATNNATAPTVEIVAGVIIISIFAITDVEFALGEDSREAFLTFLAAALMAFQPLKALTRLQVSLANGITNLGNMYAFIDRASKRSDGPTPSQSIADSTIRFEGVTFGYVSDRPVFRNLSFCAEPGQITALIGPSGCGKTTILSLIEQFIVAQSGTIRIGDHTLSSARRTHFGDQIALVTQDTFLFRGTIAENIACGLDTASREDIAEAARKADADTFIRELPDGYETMVGGEALTLSAGQRQRLAIARAMLRNPPILLLDEATSALDPVTEARVIGAIERLMTGRTTILVTHNMALLQRAHRIWRMGEAGQIAEFSHADLDQLSGRHGD